MGETSITSGTERRNSTDVSSITILLADGNHVVRQSIRALLETEQDFSIVGETANGLDAIRLVGTARPQILITDFVLPGLGGLELTRQARKKVPDLKVIILATRSDESIVTQALNNGASGYVLKTAPSAALMMAVRSVIGGETFLSAELPVHWVDYYLNKANAADGDPYETLTVRECQVLQSVAEGLSSSEAGWQFGISTRTVEVHRANLMRKLGLNTQTDLVRYAIQRGLISVELSK